MGKEITLGAWEVFDGIVQSRYTSQEGMARIEDVDRQGGGSRIFVCIDYQYIEADYEYETRVICCLPDFNPILCREKDT